MRFVIVFTVMFAVILGANFYVFHRLWHIMPAYPLTRTVLVCMAVFLLLSPFVSILLGSHIPLPATVVMFRVGTSWIIIMLYLIFILLLMDLMRLAGIGTVQRLMAGSWAGFGVLALLTGALTVGGYINYRNKKRVEFAINIDKKTAAATSLKIVAISDLHLGYGIGPGEFRKWVQLINREEPDVLLIAGDAIDTTPKALYQRNFTAVFGEIKTKYGIYFAPGNHEYISGIDESIRFLTRAGVTVLRDSVVAAGSSCFIAGRDDQSNTVRKSLNELIAPLNTQNSIVIVLNHQPNSLGELENSGVDLQISGHTHNGQVWPVSLITRAMYETSHGCSKKGDTHIYVSSGIGIWGGKFRIGTKSEYAVIHINSHS